MKCSNYIIFKVTKLHGIGNKIKEIDLNFDV